MNKIFVILMSIVSISIFDYSGPERFRIATTTSLYETGLLNHLLTDFEAKYNIEVDVISVGTGKAFKLGENGDVDLILVHAPEAEEVFVDNGFGIKRKQIMYNDFVIIGPEEDPAGIKDSKNAEEALQRIADTGSKYISRGDDSGTHKKEKNIWFEAGIIPGGKWYNESGQGMTATIMMADEKRAYCLADRATYLSLRNKILIRTLFEDENNLINPYSVILLNPHINPHVKYEYGECFLSWISMPRSLRKIDEFRKDGMKLFSSYRKKIG